MIQKNRARKNPRPCGRSSAPLCVACFFVALRWLYLAKASENVQASWTFSTMPTHSGACYFVAHMSQSPPKVMVVFPPQLEQMRLPLWSVTLTQFSVGARAKTIVRKIPISTAMAMVLMFIFPLPWWWCSLIIIFPQFVADVKPDFPSPYSLHNFFHTKKGREKSTS